MLVHAYIIDLIIVLPLTKIFLICMWLEIIQRGLHSNPFHIISNNGKHATLPNLSCGKYIPFFLRACQSHSKINRDVVVPFLPSKIYKNKLQKLKMDTKKHISTCLVDTFPKKFRKLSCNTAGFLWSVYIFHMKKTTRLRASVSPSIVHNCEYLVL